MLPFVALLNMTRALQNIVPRTTRVFGHVTAGQEVGRDNFSFPSISILLVLARVRHHTSEESDQIANSVPPKLIEFLWSIPSK